VYACGLGSNLSSKALFFFLFFSNCFASVCFCSTCPLERFLLGSRDTEKRKARMRFGDSRAGTAGRGRVAVASKEGQGIEDQE